MTQQYNKAFIFDMDGVLINSESVWAKYENDFLDKLLGKEISQKIGDTVGTSVNTIYDRAVSYGFTLSREEFQNKYDEVAISVYKKAHITQGLDELVTFLTHEGFHLGIVTASGKSWINQVLPRLAFRDNIEHIISLNEQIYRMAIDTKYAGWNCSAGFNPIKEEGIKIIGFEIWEDIGVPDVIVVPCGNGTLLFGIYKAFKELKHLGFINRLPKFVGVQIKDSSSLQEALKQGKDFVKLTNVPDSIAEGIIGEESFSAPKVMLALKDTHGEIIAQGSPEEVAKIARSYTGNYLQKVLEGQGNV